MEREGVIPKLAVDHGLQLCGQYYEGFVDNYEALLSHHRMETVTSYGVRRINQGKMLEAMERHSTSRMRGTLSYEIPLTQLTRYMYM